MDTATNSDISSHTVQPATVVVQNLSASVSSARTTYEALTLLRSRKDDASCKQPRRKTILDTITAEMPSGSLTAIMGASGSGKTSLLNSLAKRSKNNLITITGSVLYNGSANPSAIQSAYVIQQDLLLPGLTVRETLQFAAEMRLPPSITPNERRAIVEKVILELGLKECAATRIGNGSRKACSGGEKRRTSLGIQMLSNPAVLFLDEVTTGLDALSALQLVHTLKKLAATGRTIIATIHQPRSEIWALFDRLVLLSEGSLIYSGPASASMIYFDRLGYTLPDYVNPAEFLIDLTAIDTRQPELEASSRARLQTLKDAWRAAMQHQTLGETRQRSPISMEVKVDEHLHLFKPGFYRSVIVQTARSTKTIIRDPFGIFTSLFEAACLGIVAGWIFFKTPETLQGIKSREGALYCAAVLQGYLILLQETYRLSTDIQLFDEERMDGLVGVFSFLISRRLSKLLLEDLTVPLIFSLVFYFLVGFSHSVAQYLAFYAIILLCHFVSVTFATVCVAAFRDFPRASLVANLAFTLQSICSGLFIQSERIPVYVRWIKYIAYVWYANGALVYNEFLAHASNPAGHLYACPESAGYVDPACKPYEGTYIVESLGFPFRSLKTPILALVAFVIVFFATSAVLLKYNVPNSTATHVHTTQNTASADDHPISLKQFAGRRSIDLRLRNYGVVVHHRNILWRTTAKSPLLRSINTSFNAGLLNVIMGPSGSGKTTLLNAITRRLRSTLGTHYELQGDLFIRGAIPNPSVVRSVSSFVEQDDEHLIPTLTVRETLRYAASLRLPSWMPSQQKMQTAESVIIQLKLRDCADTLVGGHGKGGISKGEKRRVTIGVQLLTDPHLLILDEPTSGLDAFTAGSIIEVLRSLAAQNRTIIFTIHQPRSDFFQHFGHVLLLARGGYPVYSGGAQAMLPYFSNLGYDCPKTMNPADFALDLVTVDLQGASEESETSERVSLLLNHWKTKKTLEGGSSDEHCLQHISTPAELGSLKRGTTPLLVALPLLLQRSITRYRRAPGVLDARIAQVFGFAAIMTLFWAPLKSEYEDIQSRVGFVQQQMGLYFVGMLQNVALYPAERDLFYSEHDDRACSVEAFLLHYTVLEIPFEIISALLFAVLATFAVGLPRTAAMFFIEALNCFCLVSCGESLGIMFNTFFDHSGFAVSATSVVLSVALMMAGLLSVNLPAFLQAFNHLSPAKWSAGNLAPYTLRGQKFTCKQSQLLADGTCPISTGEEVLRLYNLDVRPELYLMALGICCVAYRLAAYLLLKAKRTEWSWKHVAS